MKIELTRAELVALWLASSEVMEHGDVLEQTFPNAHTRAAAERAYEKLGAVIKRKRRKADRTGP